MALDDSALLEMIEMLRTADGGELMRRHREPAIAGGGSTVKGHLVGAGRGVATRRPRPARLSRSSLRLAKAADGWGQVADLRGE